MTVDSDALSTAIELAERNANQEAPWVQRIVDNEGVKVEHVLLSHEDGHDIIIFGASSMDECGWTPVLGVLDYSVGPLGSMGGIWDDSLHLRVPSVHRLRLLPFLHDLLNRVIPASVEASVWGIIEEWSELFDRIGSPLSIMEQRGLFGELVVLEKLLASHGSDAVGWWVGPRARRHDFISEKWEIEVKSSIRIDPVAHIHPIDQLEPTVLPFHLVMIGLNDSGSTSLSELVSRIEDSFTEPSTVTLFSDLLTAVGFSMSDTHHYPTRYDVTSMGYLPIDESTRILRPSSISPGTVYEDVRWTLRKSSLPFEEVSANYWSTLEED